MLLRRNVTNRRASRVAPVQASDNYRGDRVSVAPDRDRLVCRRDVMGPRNPAVLARALRAAAATTGLILAGCGGSKGTQPAQPPASTGGDEGSATAPASDTPDGEVAAERTCEDDPGYGSACCTEEREAGRSPVACTPWGPPAPPAYSGEQLA
jgi:hypothetical protein